MSIMPWKGNGPHPEGIYGQAKADVPGFLRDLGVHLFGQSIEHVPGAEPGQKALMPKSRLGKAVVKKAYGPEGNPILGYSNRISKPRKR